MLILTRRKNEVIYVGDDINITVVGIAYRKIKVKIVKKSKIDNIEISIGEVYFISDNIDICLLSIKSNQARIGTNAPKEIPIHREEIYKRIKAGKK